MPAATNTAAPTPWSASSRAAERRGGPDFIASGSRRNHGSVRAASTPDPVIPGSTKAAAERLGRVDDGVQAGPRIVLGGTRLDLPLLGLRPFPALYGLAHGSLLVGKKLASDAFRLKRIPPGLHALHPRGRRMLKRVTATPSPTLDSSVAPSRLLSKNPARPARRVPRPMPKRRSRSGRGRPLRKAARPPRCRRSGSGRRAPPPSTRSPGRSRRGRSRATSAGCSGRRRRSRR